MIKILAIDDNNTNLILIKKLLENNFDDIEVTTAKSGQEGIDLTRSLQPDTILLDIQMPEMNGFEVCKILKTDQNTQHIPILFVTAVYDDTASRIKGLELGAEGFISKPFTAGELIAKVKVMLRIKKAEDRMRTENVLLEAIVKERTKKLQESEEFFRLLFTNLNSGFAVHELVKNEKGDIIDTRIIQSNEMFKNIVNANDVDGKLLSEVFLEEDPYWLITYLKVAITGKSEKFTRYSKYLDKHLEVSVYSPHIGKFVTIIDDISKRIFAEEQVAYEKAYFEQLFQSAPEGIVLTDNQHNILRANSAFLKLFQYKIEDINGKNINTVLVPQHLIDEASFISDVVAGGNQILRESLRKRSDGNLLDVSILGAPIIINDKQEGIFGIYRNIADRKIMENELKDTLEFNNLLIKESPVGIMVFSDKGKCLLSNDAAKSIIGINDSEYLIGKSINEIEIWNDSDLITQFSKTIENWQYQSFTFCFNPQSVKMKWLEIYIVPVITKAERRIMIMLWDITSLKENEIKIEHKLAEQKLISEIAYELNKIEYFNNAIDKVLALLGDYLVANRLFLFIETPFNNSNDNNYEWNRHPAADDIKYKEKNLIEQWFYKNRANIQNPNLFILNNFEMIDDEALQAIGLNNKYSYYVLPLIVFNNINGFICIETVKNSENNCLENKDLLITASHIITNSIERIRISENLKNSEEKFRQLAENIEDSVILIQNNDVLYINPAFEKTFSIDEQYVYANPMYLTKFFARSDRYEILQFLKNPHEKSFNREIKINTLDSSLRWIWIRIFPIYDNSKIAYRHVTIVSDITEKKEIEAQIVKTIIKTEEKERRRFSEDLHDSLGPLMSSVKLYLNLLFSKTKDGISTEELQKLIKFIEKLVDEGIINTKDIANSLTPHVLSDYGLGQALKQFFKTINDSNALIIRYELINVEERFEQDIEINFYRIVKELINNSLKHALAKTIFIKLEKSNNSISLRYSDDGIGFDYAQLMKDKNAGLGLRNIQNRVKSMNGSIQIISSPNQGINVDINIIC